MGVAGSLSGTCEPIAVPPAPPPGSPGKSALRLVNPPQAATTSAAAHTAAALDPMEPEVTTNSLTQARLGLAFPRAMRPSRRHFTALVALGLVAPRLARAHKSGAKELTCPVDRTKFTVNVTMSYTTFSQLRDFAKQGAIGDLYESYVHCCPKCRFAGYQDDFDKPVSAAAAAWQLDQAKMKWASRSVGPADECEAAADRFAFEQRPADDIAQLYLVASYVLRGKKGALAKQRQGYQRRAALYLVAALAADKIKANERGGNTYLAAEMHRRSENFTAALTLYDAALKEPSNPAGLVTWIKEQRALATKHDANNDI